MNIGLFTSVYFNNIGNGFLDLGTEYELLKAKSNDDVIVKVSQCANFAASLGRLFAVKQIPFIRWTWEQIMNLPFAKKTHNKAYDVVQMKNVLSPASMFDLDYLVIPGCVLTIHFFKIYYDLLKKKTEDGCKIIFIGASGNYYTPDEVEYVSKCLEELKPYAIMTRDSEAFKYYSSYSENVYNGIDNAFFVNRLNIPKLKSSISPYVVINLEEKVNQKTKETIIREVKQKGYEVLFSDHIPYPYTRVAKIACQNDTIISDYPLDYLVLYKNATAVYTDRVHTTITTLSFGNNVTLYSNSPRKSLLENVGVVPKAGKALKIIDLEIKQEKQIEFLHELLK